MTTSRTAALGAFALSLSLVVGPAAWAQALPVPSQGVFSADVAAPVQTPNPKLNYKVVFEVTEAAKTAGEPSPGLVRAAMYLNTLAKYGVPPANRHIAVVISGPATDAVANAATFAAKNAGAANPNLTLIDELHKAGVALYVCGYAMKMHKLTTADLAPHIQASLAATTTLLNLQTEGYARTK